MFYFQARPKSKYLISVEEEILYLKSHGKKLLHVIYYRDIFVRNLRYFRLHRANLLHKIPVMNL